MYQECAPDLLPFLATGKPLRISRSTQREFVVARLPTGVSIDDLKQPLKVTRDVPTNEDGTPMLTGTVIGSGGSMLRDRRRSTGFDFNQLPWRLVDGSDKHIVGHRSGLDMSTYFVVVDQGSFGELIPLDGWLNFQQDVQPGANRGRTGGVPLDVEAAERRVRQLRRDDERVDGRLETMRSRGSEASRDGVVEGVEDPFGEDAGLHRQERKRMKRLIKAKAGDVKNENENFESSLAVGQLKKAAVDWDFDDDGKATDDEEGHEAEELEPEDQIDESDEEDDTLLSKYGQKVNQLLEQQKENEADDELAKFSDEEDEDEEGGTHREASPNSESPEEVKTSPVSIPAAKIGLSSVPPTSIQPSRPPGSDTYESVKARVVRTLNLQGGTMPIRTFMKQFNLITKNETFKVYQGVINEVCEVHLEKASGSPDGVQTRVLELRPQFRHK